MKEENNKNQNSYQCPACGLHYRDKETAEKCEAWCKEHNSCNVEITKESEESKRLELERKCEEYLNNWKRERADFLNYKKDEAERASDLIKYAKEDLILKMLPIVDNIELAEKQLPENLKEGEGETHAVEWTKGFMQIQNQVKDFLTRERIGEIKIKVMEDEFDPATMEVIEERSVDGVKSGIVIEVVQKGYKYLLRASKLEYDHEIEDHLAGKVIRPAKVKISK